MRTTIARNVRLSHIVLAAAFALATPAAAQELASGAVRPAPALAVSRAVATYRFIGGRAEGLPAEVTVVDRGGELTASYRLPGQRAAQPMMVTVLDMDLVLQAETDKGVLTLQLFQQNDEAAAGPVRGRWTLGNRSGALRARAK